VVFGCSQLHNLRISSIPRSYFEKARLHRLRKKSGFEFDLKGRGFSRAVTITKSMPALAAGTTPARDKSFPASYSAVHAAHLQYWLSWLEAFS
jgi:hypothetical protein